MRKERRHQKIKNNPHDVDFKEALQWLQDFGFVLERIKGSHDILRHPLTKDKINLQKDKSGKAKPYQIKQALKIIQRMQKERR